MFIYRMAPMVKITLAGSLQLNSSDHILYQSHYHECPNALLFNSWLRYDDLAIQKEEFH